MFSLIRTPSGGKVALPTQMTPKELRKLIPAEVLTAVLAEAAVTGVMRSIDANGEEVAPAAPVPVGDRLKIAQYLLDKRLPAQKAEEPVPETPTSDVSSIPLDPEEIKRMPLSELGKVIEATVISMSPEVKKEPPDVHRVDGP